MVFSLPTEEMRQRQAVFGWLVTGLVLVDVVLVSLIYSNAGWVQQANFSDGQMDGTTFACTLCELVLAMLAMKGKDTRIITFFVLRQATHPLPVASRPHSEQPLTSPLCCVWA